MAFDRFTDRDKWQIGAGALSQGIVFMSVTVLPKNPFLLIIGFALALYALYKYLWYKFNDNKITAPSAKVIKLEIYKHLSYSLIIAFGVNIILLYIWGYQDAVLNQPTIWDMVLSYFSIPPGLAIITGTLAAIGNDLRRD